MERPLGGTRRHAAATARPPGGTHDAKGGEEEDGLPLAEAVEVMEEEAGDDDAVRDRVDRVDGDGVRGLAGGERRVQQVQLRGRARDEARNRGPRDPVVHDLPAEIAECRRERVHEDVLCGRACEAGRARE